MKLAAPTSDGRRLFWCLGCNEWHWVNDTWAISGTDEAPTIQPSVLVTSGHFIAGHQPGADCWCTYNEKHPDAKVRFSCRRCHSFITAGMIQYLDDSTHALAGQTVALPDVELHL